MTENTERWVIVLVEPSKRLSELCGFPDFIDRRVSLSELLKKHIIDEDDIKQMEQGLTIRKKIPVV